MSWFSDIEKGAIIMAIQLAPLLARGMLALGPWGPVILGAVAATAAYTYLNKRRGSYDQSKTEAEIKDAMGKSAPGKKDASGKDASDKKASDKKDASDKKASGSQLPRR